MHTSCFSYSSHCIKKIQNSVYQELNDFKDEEENPSLRKAAAVLLSFPVAILDIGLETLKSPATVLEQLAIAVIHIAMSAFSSEYSIRVALLSLESSLSHLFATPVKILLSPLKIAYQIFANIENTIKEVDLERFTRKIREEKYTKKYWDDNTYEENATYSENT